MNPFDEFRTIDGLEKNGAILYECVTGSHSYGTATPKSDIDKKGVFCFPLSLFPSIFCPPREATDGTGGHDFFDEVTDGTDDRKFFELAKFFKLAATSNPTVIELLWTPQDCVIRSTPAWEEILRNRSLFVSKMAMDAFTGYAYSQVKKAKGQNKMVMREWPIDRPQKQDFCWVIPFDGVGSGWRHYATLPGRPIPLKESGIDLSLYHVASLEHVQDGYRLYFYGDSSKGVFRGDGMLVPESIPLDDETKRFSGFLIWNRNAYEQALRDHERYWTWKRERNEARWEGQDGEAFKYDRKNMMHCVRLILSGRHILETGEPIVRFEGDQLQLLRSVRAGEKEFEEIMEMVEREITALEAMVDSSPLPDKPDLGKIDALCKKVYNIHYEEKWVLRDL